ncbi:hypothetical protein SLEP1_g30006 [Rubroshorea leprosula]|uniref:Uncharacterized protein n=1 Tax=Rubroshorea leprosula TaxID=152421 RepID=A0AAV5K6R8_9ROSI|nr:hypothetical protein SLEP1_g30006 [Rubroshorea leprosula]
MLTISSTFASRIESPISMPTFLCSFWEKFHSSNVLEKQMLIIWSAFVIALKLFLHESLCLSSPFRSINF